MLPRSEAAGAFPARNLVDAAPEWLLRHWWLTMPAPRSEAEVDVAEAVAVRAEGCGLVRMGSNGEGVLR